MINFFAKSVAATYVWKRYKKIIISTAALFLGYFLINAIHHDFLEYQKLSGSGQQLLLSYILKWLALGAITALYYYINIHNRIKNGKEPLTKSSKQQANSAKNNKAENQTENSPDPFANIRKKETLRSRADIEMDKRK